MKNTSGLLTAILAFAASALAAQPTASSSPADHIMPVVQCSDFELTGDGNESAWSSAQWTTLNPRQPDFPYETRFKIMYSDSGIILFVPVYGQRNCIHNERRFPGSLA